MLGRIVPLYITRRLLFVACLSRFTIALFIYNGVSVRGTMMSTVSYSDTVSQNEGNWLCFDMPLFNQLNIRRPITYRTKCVFLTGFRDNIMCSI